jgi:ribosomal protein S18 acetylase RimI-like enzyme
VQIRRATVGDARQIAALHIASWRATYTAELSASFLAGLDSAARVGYWVEELERGTMVVAAYDAGELVGFVACGEERVAAVAPRDGVWEIYNLHVSPERHRRNIGSALFEKALHLAGEDGATEMVLWVVRTNAGARRFYERHGMEPDGASHDRALAPREVLNEIRYRMMLTGA